MTDAEAARNKLETELLAWLKIESNDMIGGAILQDAIRQAVNPHTTEWLATLAERYGFKRST